MNIAWIDKKDVVTIFEDAERYYLETDGFWRVRKNGSNICINEMDVKLIGVADDVLTDETDS